MAGGDLLKSLQMMKFDDGTDAFEAAAFTTELVKPWFFVEHRGRVKRVAGAGREMAEIAAILAACLGHVEHAA